MKKFNQLTATEFVEEFLSGNIPPSLFQKSQLPHDPESDLALGEVMQLLIFLNAPINAENVYKFSKNMTTIYRYMSIVNKMDFKRSETALESSQSDLTSLDGFCPVEARRMALIGVLENLSGKSHEELLAEARKMKMRD